MRRFIVISILVSFFMTGQVGVCPVYGSTLSRTQEFVLPKPGVMVPLSPTMNPPILKGIKVHTDNPFRFDFILDHEHCSDDKCPNLRDESTRLIKYFLASITTPEGDLWVNLSPYEKDRIVPTSFGQTEMGRDLLAQDYMLKQITASLIYPEDELGKKFWKRIYEEAQAKYGTTNIPVNTFNKVWIVPDKAVVYENSAKKDAAIDGAGHTAYVVESRLRVMLEVDYLSLEKNIVGAGPRPARSLSPGAGLEPARTDVNQLGSQIVREIVIPALTREVNEGANFAQLRQVYNSLILATWYKKKIKDSILAKVYADQNKVTGIEGHDLNVQTIYNQYLTAFKKGVYNYIKDDIDLVTRQPVPRKYFSGGIADLAMRIRIEEMNEERLLETITGQERFSIVSSSIVADVPPFDQKADYAELVVPNEELPIEYWGNIALELHSSMERFRRGEPIDEEFIASLLDRVAAPYFKARGIEFSAASTKNIAKNDPNADLKRTVRQLHSFLQNSGFFPRQRHFGFILSAFIGEQGFDDYRNIYIPRDMGPGYPIQEVLDGLIAPNSKKKAGTYYLSRNSLGEDYYRDITEIIADEKLSGTIASAIAEELKAVSLGEEHNTPEYRRLLKREIGRQMDFLIREGKRNIEELVSELFQEDVIKSILLRKRIKKGQEVSLPQDLQVVMDAIQALKVKSPRMRRQITEQFASKQKISYLDRIAARIKKKTEGDPAFNRVIEGITEDFIRLGFIKDPENPDAVGDPKIRFVDSGAGTFPILFQAVCKIKAPDVQTKSLVLGLYNKDLIDVFDVEKWNSGIQELVENNNALQQYVEYPLGAMESSEKFILHPIAYDANLGGIKRTNDDVHLMANWILVNFGLATIDYVKALKGVVESGKAENVAGAAKHLRDQLGLSTYEDTETGQTLIASGDAISTHAFDENLPEGASPANPMSVFGLPGLPNGFQLKGGDKRLAWLIALLALLIPLKIGNEGGQEQSLPQQPPTPNVANTNQGAVSPMAKLDTPATTDANVGKQEPDPNNPNTDLNPNQNPKPQPQDLIVQSPVQTNYTVRKGDTWSDLAFSFYGDGTKAVYMKLYNDNFSPDPVRLLRINRDVVVPGEVVDYTIHPGDTVASVALKFYGKSSKGFNKRIWKFNRINTNKKLVSGSTLRIPLSPEEATTWKNTSDHSSTKDQAMIPLLIRTGIHGIRGTGWDLTNEDVTGLISGLSDRPEKKGIFVGVGSFHNFDIALSREAEAIILIDHDEDVVDLNVALMELIRDTDSFDGFLNTVEQFLFSRMPGVFTEGKFHSYTHDGESTPGRTPLLWAKNEKDFLRLKQLIGEERVVIVHGDVFNTNSMKKLGMVIRTMQLPIQWINVSNIENYESRAFYPHRQKVANLSNALKAMGAATNTQIIASMPNPLFKRIEDLFPEEIILLKSKIPKPNSYWDFRYTVRTFLSLKNGVSFFLPEEKVKGTIKSLKAGVEEQSVTLADGTTVYLRYLERFEVDGQMHVGNFSEFFDFHERHSLIGKDVAFYGTRFMDKAMGGERYAEQYNTGGIDLTSNKFLQTQNQGESIGFHLDPAQLEQFQNAPGFTPVIISIQPMTNLREFFGLSKVR